MSHGLKVAAAVIVVAVVGYIITLIQVIGGIIERVLLLAVMLLPFAIAYSVVWWIVH